MKMGKIYIGTSGWHYKHWKGIVYPANIADEEQLKVYCTKFKTVEINNSFYKLPASATFTSWRKASPVDFLFSVKGSRFFTHLKKLKLGKEDIQLFFKRVRFLKDKLGPILFQLPPRWSVNTERLEHFLSILPSKYRYAFEFRDTSWYNGKTYDLLRQYDCAFCIYELAGHQSPVKVTSQFVYIRLHGPTKNKYQGSYTSAQLKAWAKKCMGWQEKGKDVYLYFDNDQAGYAVLNAEKMLGLLRKEPAK